LHTRSAVAPDKSASLRAGAARVGDGHNVVEVSYVSGPTVAEAGTETVVTVASPVVTHE